MLYFPLIWVVTSKEIYSSMKYIQPIFYVSSFCLYTKLQFTDTNEYKAEKKTTLYVSCLLVNIDVMQNTLQSIFQTIMFLSLLFYKYFGSFHKQNGKNISDIPF